jgi:ATP-dependent DNA helicase RecG
LEIASTGILSFDLTPEDLKRLHASRPWNPLITNVFYRRNIIESWGRGTIRMAELTEAAGLTATEIESSGGAVAVRFQPLVAAPGMMAGLN